MSLTYHFEIAEPSTLVQDSATTLRTKLNANSSLWNTELQSTEDAFEDTFSTLFGEGLTSTPTVTTSTSSLSVTVAQFYCLIGREINYSGGVFTALANQTDASIYFCQDSTWSNTLPTTKSYLVFGTYTSTGVGVTSFTLSDGILIPKIVASVTDTVSDIVVPEAAGYADYFVDHESLGSFEINGFLTLNITPTTDFYVELLYAGCVHDTSDTQYSPPRNITKTGFHIRITRKSGYYYATNPTCDFTYTRTGLAIAA